MTPDILPEDDSGPDLLDVTDETAPPGPEPDPATVDAALDAAAAGNTDESAWDFAFRRAAAKVREFPRKPGKSLLPIFHDAIEKIPVAAHGLSLLVVPSN